MSDYASIVSMMHAIKSGKKKTSIVSKNKMTLKWLNNTIHDNLMYLDDDGIIIETGLESLINSMTASQQASKQIGAKIARFLNYFTHRELTANTPVSELFTQENKCLVIAKDYEFMYLDDDFNDKMLSDMINIPHLWFTEDGCRFEMSDKATMNFINLIASYDTASMQALLTGMADYYKSGNVLIKQGALAMMNEIYNNNLSVDVLYHNLTNLSMMLSNLNAMIDDGWGPSVSSARMNTIVSNLMDNYDYIYQVNTIHDCVNGDCDYNLLACILAYCYVIDKWLDKHSKHDATVSIISDIVLSVLSTVNMPSEFISEMLKTRLE